MDSSVSDWSDAVYDKLEHGYSLNNYLRQAYIMPDWKKLYPLVGDPPVWSSENLQDYEDLLKEITQLLKPRDLIELIYTKEMADAIWEEKRESREKNSVPERQYQVRLSEAHAVRVAEARRRNLPTPKQAVPEPATALDHIRGFRTGFNTYRALDIAQCRKKKRRDNAPRQITRWRDRFGGKAEALPDKFVAELALAKRDGVAQFLSDTQPDDILDESMQADPSSAPGGGTVNGPHPLAHTEEVAQAATSVALPDAIAQSASGADPANTPESPSRVADTGEPARAPTDNAPPAGSSREGRASCAHGVGRKWASRARACSCAGDRESFGRGRFPERGRKGCVPARPRGRSRLARLAHGRPIQMARVAASRAEGVRAILLFEEVDGSASRAGS
jgi:hypothetical protein